MEEAHSAFGKYGLKPVVRNLSEDDPDLIVIGKQTNKKNPQKPTHKTQALISS